MADDSELLRAYAVSGSHQAFRELVARHLPAVLGVCIRRCGSRCLAEEAAQQVFVDLARKAKRLQRHTSLSGWLFLSARYASATLVRTEVRRHAALERAARQMSAETDFLPQPPSEDAHRLLDPMLERLKAKDREVLFLRFYQQQSYAAIGSLLNLGESAARMRVDRALDRLRGEFARKSVTTSAGALAAALAASAATPVTPAFYATIAIQATAVGTATPFSLLALMASNALKIATGASLLTLLAVSYYAHQKIDSLQRQEIRTVEELAQERLQASLLGRQLAKARSMSPSNPGSVVLPTPSRPSSDEVLRDHPALRPLFDRMARRQIERIFGSGIAALNLPPDKARQLRDAILKKEESFGDTRDACAAQGIDISSPLFSKALVDANRAIDAELASLVTPEQLKQLELAAKAESTSSQVSQQMQNYALDMAAAGVPLSAHQALALTTLASKNLLPNLNHDSAVTVQALAAYDPSTDLRPVDTQFIQEAGAVLSPAQVSVLQNSIADQHRQANVVRTFGSGLIMPSMILDLHGISSRGS